MVGGIEFNTLMPQEASILKEGTELLKDTKKNLAIRRFCKFDEERKEEKTGKVKYYTKFIFDSKLYKTITCLLFYPII